MLSWFRLLHRTWMMCAKLWASRQMEGLESALFPAPARPSRASPYTYYILYLHRRKLQHIALKMRPAQVLADGHSNARASALLRSNAQTFGYARPGCRWAVYRKWMEVLSSKRHKDNVYYTYEPTGSGDGKAKFVNRTVPFAGSDLALSAEEKLAIPDAWFVPSLAGGVAVGFNVPGIGSEELSIPREALADVFLGKIRRWSGLAQWNPKLETVSQDISIVVRSESSGTTSVITSALSSFSAEWKNKTGSSGLPKWPVAASKHEGNAGVAVGIRVTPYSIGYLNVADAKTYGVAYAKIANAEGRYIAPTLEAVQAATNAFGPKLEALVKNGSTNFYVDAVDPKGEPAAYPISTFTYLAFDVGRMDCETMLDVLFFVYWAWTDANAGKYATEQLLSPITSGVRAILLSALAKLKCEGESPMGKVQLAFGLGCKPGAERPPFLPPPLRTCRRCYPIM